MKKLVLLIAVVTFTIQSCASEKGTNDNSNRKNTWSIGAGVGIIS